MSVNPKGYDMSSQGYSRDTTEGDLEFLAKNLRDADKDEIKAMVGWEPLPALRFALRHSQVCRTGLLSNHEPVMIYGVTPSPIPGIGTIWMLATDGLLKGQTTFLRRSRNEILEISQGYKAVSNYTDARNTVHHRWLKWCGFTFIRKQEEYGFERRPFFEFVKLIGA